MKRLDEIFGKVSGHEIEKATTDGKIVERIEELSKRETKIEEWERMRRESKDTEGRQKTEHLLEEEQDLPH